MPPSEDTYTRAPSIAAELPDHPAWPAPPAALLGELLPSQGDGSGRRNADDPEIEAALGRAAAAKKQRRSPPILKSTANVAAASVANESGCKCSSSDGGGGSSAQRAATRS